MIVHIVYQNRESSDSDKFRVAFLLLVASFENQCMPSEVPAVASVDAGTLVSVAAGVDDCPVKDIKWLRDHVPRDSRKLKRPLGVF